jgi:phosphoribosylglycinamide formyltransferase-1
VNILVLVSGGGSNLQALIDAEKQGGPGPGKIAVVVSDRPGAYALERAHRAGIPALTEPANPGLSGTERRRELSDRILGIARERDIGLIILAGFLSILEGELITAYAGRIINLHPSLLPRFGGAGMYGERVHRAVLDVGETESGCTVHLVDAGTDTGPILLQRRVPVLAGDTPDALAERVRREEHRAIVEAAALMVRRLKEEPGPCAKEEREGVYENETI